MAVMDGPSMCGSQSERDRKVVSSPAQRDPLVDVPLLRRDSAIEQFSSGKTFQVIRAESTSVSISGSLH